MDLVVLGKRLSTYVSESGRLQNVGEDVLFDLLSAWEGWSGSAKEFYRGIGFSHKQMAKLLGKAKKLKREGHFGQEAFKEISLPALASGYLPEASSLRGGLVELQYPDGRVIRFAELSQLLAFMKAG